jgi:putative methyltransferase (TIGR04325 family)
MTVNEQPPPPVAIPLEETYRSTLSLTKRARVRQIRICSHWFRVLSGFPAFLYILRATRELPIVRNLLAVIVGYNRPFETLVEAQQAMAAYAAGGHANPACAVDLMGHIERASPSDYAALFFLQPLLPFVRTIFDFGGNVGNLFYCYSRYLDFPADLTWTVYDLPENVKLGERIAADSGAYRLRFTTSLSDGDGADLFIATGALHYFEKPLADMLAEFKKKPRYVLVNRTPLVDGPRFATVQDNGLVYRVACMLYNRNDLIQEFEKCGYEMLESWSAAERSFIIPCYPDRSPRAYSGMFFRLRHAA